MIWCFSSSVSTVRLDRYCFTFLAIWASSYSFLALSSELRRTRFLWAPPCTSSMLELVLPWLKDLIRWGDREEEEGRGGRKGEGGNAKRQRWEENGMRWRGEGRGNLKEERGGDEVLMDKREINEEGRGRGDAHESIKKENKKGRLKEWRKRTVNNNQSNTHKTGKASFSSNTSSALTSVHLSSCWSTAFYQQDHATGGEAALARVPCHHSKEQQNILSD